MRSLLLIILICFFNFFGISQTVKVSNIHYRLLDQEIQVIYDLPRNFDSLQIQLIFYKRSDLTFKYRPKKLSGDIGRGVFSGKNKKVTWTLSKEPAYLFSGAGFHFDVVAKRL